MVERTLVPLSLIGWKTSLSCPTEQFVIQSLLCSLTIFTLSYLIWCSLWSPKTLPFCFKMFICMWERHKSVTRVKAELKSGKIPPLLCIFLLAALHSDEMCALLITICFRITPKLNCSQEECDIRNIFLLSMTSHQPINTEVPWSWSGILLAPAVVATNSSSCWTLER